MPFERALALKDIPRGQMRACILGGREIVVCHTKAGVFALDNICTHAHARMNEGRLRGLRLFCPLHGASFDVRDGRVLSAPATIPLPRYEVRVVDGFVEVAFDHSTLNQSTSA
jgi:nitrite reductase/ring-hydroxylating ferredoxin subunit